MEEINKNFMLFEDAVEIVLELAKRNKDNKSKKEKVAIDTVEDFVVNNFM